MFAGLSASIPYQGEEWKYSWLLYATEVLEKRCKYMQTPLSKIIICRN